MSLTLRKATVLLAAIMVMVAGLTITQPDAARASGACSTSWAYVGGSFSTGGCKAAVNDTWYRVGQKCGWLMAVTYSPWTRIALRGQTSTVSTAPCPWYSQGSRAAWVEW